MKRVLITGMSGTGKSVVIQELIGRGYRAYDLDTPEWSEWIDADPSDVLTPRQGETGFGEKIAFARSCPGQEMRRCSSAAAPRTWLNSSI